ncbi:TolC family outer membrane protein [Ramlibacter sp. WS9]|uniref:TolC family outer membrane protein n=1 Tax=Ramlibacter sp. WS9 TaxID=1882741 RepID=UPI0011430AB6|nr:TolC family outer membrane protein [Ramlibacter sp. WS9]ROZ77441.1 channel protein TolC [Ramlibacter sp. WS9]
MQRLMACCLLAAAPVLVVPPAAAQPAPAAGTTPQTGATLTLAQAYRAALEQDATLRAARAGADSRRERLPQARALLLPNVSVSASRNKNDLDSRTPGLGGQPVNSERDYMSGSRALTVRQPLYRPYQWADVRQAEAQVADANAQLEKEVQNLAVRLTSTYLEALLAQDQLELVMQQKQTYTTQLDAARKRFAGGSGVRTDVDEAQARLDLVQANELEARQHVDYTRRALQVLVNQPVTQLARIDPARLKLVRPDPDRLEDWTARAELNSPDLRSLQAQREAARHEIDKARAGHLPTLDAIAQWTYSNSDSVNSIDTRHKNKAIGLQLNVPIYSGGGVSSQIRQTLADLERAEQIVEATRRDLTLRVEKEFRGVTEGVLRIRALEQAVRSNDVLVVSNRRSFEGGSRTLVDVLNAEEQRFVALRDLAQARYQYALARVRLQTLSGTGNEVSISEVDSWLKP